MEIGGVLLSIESEINAVLQENEPAYRSFFRKADKDERSRPIDIKVHLEPSNKGNMPRFQELTKIFDSGRSWAMFRQGDVYWLTRRPPPYKSPLWLARFEPGATEVYVYCGEPLIAERHGKRVLSNPLRYPLDQLLLMYILAQKKGAILHAAGIDINGEGLVLPGKSGAGKSTLAKLFDTRKDAGILSDDRVILRKIDGTFRAFGTPWPGEGGLALNQSMPLSGILFLCHGTGNRAEEITPKEALTKLLPVTSIPWYDKDIIPGVLSFCEDLVSHIPCFEFHFTPGSAAVKFLEKFAANLSKPGPGAPG